MARASYHLAAYFITELGPNSAVYTEPRILHFVVLTSYESRIARGMPSRPF
jgi:hypothetical protein